MILNSFIKLIFVFLISLSSSCALMFNEAALEWELQSGASNKDISKFIVFGKEVEIGNNKITYTFPCNLEEDSNNDFNNVVPDITHNGVSIYPKADKEVDLSSPFSYLVVAADGSSKKYEVDIDIAPEDSKKIIKFKVGGLIATIDETSKTITFITNDTLISGIVNFEITGSKIEYYENEISNSDEVTFYDNDTIEVYDCDNISNNYSIIFAPPPPNTAGDSAAYLGEGNEVGGNQIIFNSTSLNFGQIKVGTNRPNNLSITNNTAGEVFFTTIVSSAIVNVNTSGTLNNGSNFLNIEMTPNTHGDIYENITITYSIGTDSHSETIILIANAYYEVGDLGPGGGTIYMTPTSLGEGSYYEIQNTDYIHESSYLHKWGCYNEIIEPMPGNTTFNSNIGSGLNNTLLIMNNATCAQESAAKLCDELEVENYFNDWFLPSTSELFQAIIHHPNLFFDYKYWTSFTGTQTQATTIYKNGGSINQPVLPRYEYARVRCVRSFN